MEKTNNNEDLTIETMKKELFLKAKKKHGKNQKNHLSTYSYFGWDDNRR